MECQTARQLHLPSACLDPTPGLTVHVFVKARRDERVIAAAHTQVPEDFLIVRAKARELPFVLGMVHEVSEGSAVVEWYQPQKSKSRLASLSLSQIADIMTATHCHTKSKDLGGQVPSPLSQTFSEPGCRMERSLQRTLFTCQILLCSQRWCWSSGSH